MTKSRKRKRNRYRENKVRVLKGKIRRSWPIFAVFAGFCLVLLLGAGLSRLYYALMDAPWLKVEEIEIAGLKKLEKPAILNAMAVNRGECILNLRMGQIADRLKALPPIKSASVRLDLPGRLVAEITEREPVALLKAGDIYQVDEDGILFAKGLPEENRRLPLISGLCDAEAKEGDVLPAKNLNRMRELLAGLDRCKSWLAATSIVECQWNPAGFTLVLGERGVSVDIGQENLSAKLGRLKQVLDTLHERQWNDLVTRIDLDYPGKAYLDGQFPIPKAAAQGKQSS